jgi:hypothetical protein
MHAYIYNKRISGLFDIIIIIWRKRFSIFQLVKMSHSINLREILFEFTGAIQIKAFYEKYFQKENLLFKEML